MQLELLHSLGHIKSTAFSWNDTNVASKVSERTVKQRSVKKMRDANAVPKEEEVASAAAVPLDATATRINAAARIMML